MSYGRLYIMGYIKGNCIKYLNLQYIYLINNCQGSYEGQQLRLERSWHFEYLKGLLSPLLDFCSFFNFPYATSYILSFILWFPLVILVPSIYSSNSSTLSSHSSSCSCPSTHLQALYITYLNPSFKHPLHNVVSSQLNRPLQYPEYLWWLPVPTLQS
jgi:hypothetical protein